jgi:hypothetical protein
MSNCRTLALALAMAISLAMVGVGCSKSNDSCTNGDACDDGDPCTTGETCQNGSCGGGTPRVCQASDQCHASGVCDPATGSCSNPTVADGKVCDDKNACTTGEKCQSGACGGAATRVCTATDQCHEAGVCDPAAGCSNPPKANGTVCDADSNGCTVDDACQAGVCTAGSAKTCNTLPAGGCYAASGTCQSTGNNTNTCNYAPLSASMTCTPAGSYDHCYQTWNCDGAGACSVSSNLNTCAATDCRSAGTCNQATGACDGASNEPTSKTCNDNNACTGNTTTADHCDGTGQCVGGGDFCPTGQVCNPVGPTCSQPPAATVVVVHLAKKLEINWRGLAMGADGAVYQTGDVLLPTKTFDGISITSAGSTDVFAAKYNASGTIQWAVRFGNSSTQNAYSGAAVTADGTLALGGKFMGTLDPDPLSAPAQVDFLEFLNPDGTHRFSAAYGNGLNGRFAAIAANPSLNRIAVCGSAALKPTDFVGATAIDPLPAAQPVDIIVGVFDSAGTKLWARQIGSADSELCDSITVDDSGDVYAAGKYNGAALNFGLGNLPNPGGLARRHLWVAKFNGTTGATISNAAFGSGAGIHAAKSLAVDATGRLFIAGAMSNNLPFGSIVLSVTDGSNDAYVAKLNPAAGYAADWAVRAGGVGDDEVRGVAVDSLGNPVVVGLYNEVSTGFLTLTAASGTSDAFLVKLDGGTGATVTATGGQASYGNELATQNANAIAVNRWGVGSVLNNVAFGGSFGNAIDFGAPDPASTPDLTTNGTDVFLVFGKLQ